MKISTVFLLLWLPKDLPSSKYESNILIADEFPNLRLDFIYLYILLYSGQVKHWIHI